MLELPEACRRNWQLSSRWKQLGPCRNTFVKMSDCPPSDAAGVSWVLMHKFQRWSLSSGRSDSFPHVASGGTAGRVCRVPCRGICFIAPEEPVIMSSSDRLLFVLALWGDLRLQTLPYLISLVLLLRLSGLSFSCVVNMEVCEEVFNPKNEVLTKFDLSSNKGNRR